MYKLEANDQYVNIQFKYFSLILTLFSSSWLISVILAVKAVTFFNISLTGGFIVFPITAALNLLIVECYGFKNSRQAIWCGTIVNLSYVFLINLANIIPASPEWKLESEFQAILIPHTRIIVASVISFWISGFTNSYLMARLKNNGISLLYRILVASFISITMDLSCYFFLGFFGSIPSNLLKNIFIFAYLKKLLFEILLLPLIWKLIDVFKRLENIEINDNNTKLTPFSLDNVYYIQDFIRLRK